MVESHVRHLEDLRNLSDQKALISDIRAGRLSKVEADLSERIALGDAMERMRVEPSYGLLDTIRYAIYPREALSLIKVSESSQAHKDKE